MYKLYGLITVATLAVKHSISVEKNQYVLCRHDYSERVVVSFSHQISYEYYVGNISMFIEGIALGHFYAPT